MARIRWGAGVGGTDAVSLFVNPSLGSAPFVADASKDVDMINFDKVRIAGANAVNYTFDEIRLGTSFYAVTGQPEPVPPVESRSSSPSTARTTTSVGQARTARSTIF